jgi:hypothetical protein
MSKKVCLLGVQPDPEGPPFGRVDDPVQLQKLQDYVHAHIEQIVKDLLVAGAVGAQVSGFAATLPGALGVMIAAGHVVDADGVSYELDDALLVTLAAADPANPRIDLIYATLAIDAPAETELVDFRQLRTLAELEAGAEPYVPTQLNVPTELHTAATIHVRAGNPAGSPAAPGAGAGEVPLWRVHVAAGQTVLAGGDLTDVRVLMSSLFQALASIAALQSLVTQAGLTEIVQDIIGAFLTAGTGIQLNYNDAGNVESISIQTEGLQDLVGAFISAADASVVVTYNDAGNIETIALHPTYKALLDNATNAPTANAIVKRGALGEVAVTSFAAAYLESHLVGTNPTAAHFTIEIFASNSGVNFPDAATCPGRIYVIKSVTGNNNSITPFGSQTIDGGAGIFTFTAANQARWFQSDGANWVIIGGYL